jgi:membrane protease YdiL (CAAX protease family)
MSFNASGKFEATIKRHPVAVYFALTFTISWMGALAVAIPHLLRREPLPKMSGILMFPAMLLGPSVAGIVMTRVVDGKGGLRRLVSRMSPTSYPARWSLVLLLPPILVMAVLLSLKTLVSQDYAPNHFFMGILFGVPAGFLEEIGWTGFAYPKMRSEANGLTPGILLGLLWALWHIPVIDYLGTAVPHGSHWLAFFLAFALAMTAMRVLIGWIYTNTNSVLAAQLMHVSSTGSLVIFSAPGVTAMQEAIWYAIYGFVLWIAVAIVVNMAARRLRYSTG